MKNESVFNDFICATEADVGPLAAGVGTSLRYLAVLLPQPL